MLQIYEAKTSKRGGRYVPHTVQHLPAAARADYFASYAEALEVAEREAACRNAGATRKVARWLSRDGSSQCRCGCRGGMG